MRDITVNAVVGFRTGQIVRGRIFGAGHLYCYVIDAESGARIPEHRRETGKWTHVWTRISPLELLALQSD